MERYDEDSVIIQFISVVVNTTTSEICVINSYSLSHIVHKTLVHSI